MNATPLTDAVAARANGREIEQQDYYAMLEHARLLETDRDAVLERAVGMISHLCPAHLEEAKKESFADFAAQVTCERCVAKERDEFRNVVIAIVDGKMLRKSGDHEADARARDVLICAKGLLGRLDTATACNAEQVPPDICETLEHLRNKLGSMWEVQKIPPREIIRIHHERKNTHPTPER